jgi:hypothetical protein
LDVTEVLFGKRIGNYKIGMIQTESDRRTWNYSTPSTVDWYLEQYFFARHLSVDLGPSIPPSLHPPITTFDTLEAEKIVGGVGKCRMVPE